VAQGNPVRWILTVLGAGMVAFVVMGVCARIYRLSRGERLVPDPPSAAPAAKRAVAADAGDTPRRPLNVILITVDTLRADLGFAGYDKPVSPNVDALAARSTVFERAYAGASYTMKSFGTMMIGKYMSETSRTYDHYALFHPSNVFLAERVHDGGVRTVGATCHHYFAWQTGFQQGFDVWDTTAVLPNMKDADPRPTSEQMTRAATKLLSNPKNTSGRFFAWFHYFDPHYPYVSHQGAPSFGSGLRAIYDEEVWFTDKHIGRLLDHVAQQTWAADTAIIFTADHGEAFGEHGFFRHGHELWEPIVRVPLVLYIPGAPAQRIAQKRSHIDLGPTVLDLLGLPMPSDGSLRGKSLLRDELEERDVFMDMPAGPFNDARRAIITGPSPGMKLIQKAPRVFELYDLASDPDENRNLAKEDAKTKEPMERFEAIRASLKEIPVTR
jgi:arylsulfatase A-like enzyme